MKPALLCSKHWLALQSFEVICLQIEDALWPKKYYLPLAIFSAAPCVETIFYFPDPRTKEYRKLCQMFNRLRDDVNQPTPAHRVVPCHMLDAELKSPACFKNLTRLCRLCLPGGAVPSCHELLSALPFACLTFLFFGLKAARAPLIQQILKFSELQELQLFCDTMSAKSLPPLAGLLGHTRLETWRDREKRSEGVTSLDQAWNAAADRLKAALEESANRLGVPIVVQLD